MTSRFLGSPFKSPGGKLLSQGTGPPEGADSVPGSLDQAEVRGAESAGNLLQVSEKEGDHKTIPQRHKDPGNDSGNISIAASSNIPARTPARAHGLKRGPIGQSNPNPNSASREVSLNENSTPSRDTKSGGEMESEPWSEHTTSQHTPLNHNSLKSSKSSKFDSPAKSQNGSQSKRRESSGQSESQGSSQAEIECPMCGESMVSLPQLNQHIDDIHVISDDAQHKSRHPRKTINLDLLDGNRGFSLSDQLGRPDTNPKPVVKSPTKTTAPSISRSHWKHPSSTSVCSHPSCTTLLGVKNGVVNCRKCGLLFCNFHTHYKIRLANGGSGPIYDSSGVWSRCCYNCYVNKPDLKLGTQVNSRDLTLRFVKMRQLVVDDQLLYRNKIQKRFIKLSGILVDQPAPLWFTRATPHDVLGSTWDDDATTHHCTVCFTRFNILIRKHHCRLCGKIVCDDPQGIRRGCSINVPLGRLLERLDTLNYPPKVKNTFSNLINDESIRFRCCVNCKNALLHDYKLNTLTTLTDDEKTIFDSYGANMTLKQHIQVMLPRYESLVEDGDDELGINKLRIKLMKFLREFENHTVQFKNRFFSTVNKRLHVSPTYSQHTALINNMYQSLIIFLQESLLQYKMLSDQFKAKEEAKLRAQQAEAQPVVEPRLTKKQIRELREQLMVMNEQKFMVENLIVEYTKLRNFSELESLIENKSELEKIIENLEAQLGEFGF